VAAIHAGDAPELARLIDAEPRLLRERVRGDEISPRVERHPCFRDPKLFWFVADNPTLMESVPAPIPASLALNERLPTLLANADEATRQAAFGLAIINANLDGTRIALDAGANIDGYVPVHAHSTALHQAAVNHDAPRYRRYPVGCNAARMGDS
jgi:hypothetical protein